MSTEETCDDRTEGLVDGARLFLETAVKHIAIYGPITRD